MAWTELTRNRYERNAPRYSSDLTYEEWAIVAPLLPSPNPVGRPRKVDLRNVWDAIQYIASAGCAWALCRVLGISRGWFYGFLASQPARDQRQSDRDARDLELLPRIKTFFKASKKCYGSKRIHQDLKANDETVSERRVARIMKENKVSPRLNKRRKPVTTESNLNRPGVYRRVKHSKGEPYDEETKYPRLSGRAA